MAATSSPNSKRFKLEDELDDQSATLYWPEDLIELILLKLPVKSILRFKSTCKSWNSLIRSRSFIELHRCHNLHNNNWHDLTFSRDSSNKPSEYIYAAYRYTGIRMLGSLNNGICCEISQHFAAPIVRQQIRFCNPATGEFNTITHPFIDSYGVLSVNFSTYHYGFGVVPKDSNGVLDYNMVVFQRIWSNMSVRALVYSQRRGTWELIRDPNNIRLASFIQDFNWLPTQAFVNGYCHLMAKLFDPRVPNPFCVLRFDMINEVFELIAAPPLSDIAQHNSHKSGVFVIHDHLAAVIVVHRYFPILSIEHIDVWMMMEYGVEISWTNIFSCGVRLGGYFKRFLGVSTSSKSKDGVTTIDRIFFHDRKMNLMSCDGSGFKRTYFLWLG